MYQHSIVSISPLLNFNAFNIQMAKAEEAMHKVQAQSNFEEECRAEYLRAIDGGLDGAGVATINIVGAIYEAHPWIALWCGLAVPSVIAKVVESYKNDTKCTAIKFIFNTGGGSIATIPELADVIFNCVKPTTAEIHEQCCSAGYWLASQCDTIVSTRGATVGALGVYIALVDFSTMYSEMGIKTHLITTSELKGLGEHGVALSENQIEFLQSFVNRSGEMFLSDIKRKRPSFDADLFNGAFWHAEDALDLGVIDDVLI